MSENEDNLEDAYHVQYLDEEKELSTYISRTGKVIIQYPTKSIFFGDIIQDENQKLLKKEGIYLWAKQVESVEDSEQKIQETEQNSNFDEKNEDKSFHKRKLEIISEIKQADTNSEMMKTLESTEYEAIYKGYLLDNDMTGSGEIIYDSGDKYSGDFKLNLRQGEGTYWYASTSDLYHGSWENGMKHGNGIYYVQSKTSKKISDGFTYHLKEYETLEGLWNEGFLQVGRWSHPTYEENTKRWTWLGSFQKNHPIGIGTILTENFQYYAEYVESNKNVNNGNNELEDYGCEQVGKETNYALMIYNKARFSEPRERLCNRIFSEVCKGLQGSNEPIQLRMKAPTPKISFFESINKVFEKEEKLNALDLFQNLRNNNNEDRTETFESDMSHLENIFGGMEVSKTTMLSAAIILETKNINDREEFFAKNPVLRIDEDSFNTVKNILAENEEKTVEETLQCLLSSGEIS